MLRFTSLVLSTLMLGSGALLTGCAVDNKPAESSLASTPEGVTCTKCQVTWIKVPNTAKGRVVSYTSRKSMECPDCKDAVTNFFTTGKFEHICKTCGDSMSICEAH